jgi:hypothetical protein
MGQTPLGVVYDDGKIATHYHLVIFGGAGALASGGGRTREREKRAGSRAVLDSCVFFVKGIGDRSRSYE